MSKQKKMLIISTGGTIAQTRNEKTGASVKVGSSEKVVADGFTELIGNELDEYGFEADAKQILTKDSSNIVPDDWVQIIETIEKNYDEYDSFLVTHGTNTLGYTSAALSFALGNLGKRVVLTGSQVPYVTNEGKLVSGSDALMNLQNASRVAMIPKDELVGVMVVFGSKIITGTRVKKTTSFDYDGFESYSASQLIGQVGFDIKFDSIGLKQHADLYSFHAKTADRLQVYKKFNTNIVSLTEFPGMNPRMIEILLDEMKLDGVILRSIGAGDPNIAPENEADDYTNLRGIFKLLQTRKIPIVVTTQAAKGVSSMTASEKGEDAYLMGAIPSWDMSIEAITVKLAWLLGRGMKYDQIRSEMLNPIKGEVIVSN